MPEYIVSVTMTGRFFVEADDDEGATLWAEDADLGPHFDCNTFEVDACEINESA